MAAVFLALYRGRMITLPNILASRYRPASDREIRCWSFGQVTVVAAGTKLSWQSLRQTLFDQAIVGPLKDNECACGKYHGPTYRSMICPICGVKVTAPAVRRERFGHIALPAPIEHPLESASAVMSVVPVLPAVFRESVGGKDLDKCYAELLTATDAPSTKTIVSTLFQTVLPAAVLASQWNLNELETLAHGLALISREDEWEQP